jgi:hypothetical protein
LVEANLFSHTVFPALMAARFQDRRELFIFGLAKSLFGTPRIGMLQHIERAGVSGGTAHWFEGMSWVRRKKMLPNSGSRYTM